MKNNFYETAVIINAALDDDQVNSELTRLKESITNFGGEIKDVENWGRKRLAYMVNKSKIGYYVIIRFNAPSTIVAKLERYYVLNENIIRFLTITLDKNAIEYFEKNKGMNQEAAPEQEGNTPAVVEATPGVNTEETK